MFVVYDPATTLIYNHKGVHQYDKVHKSTKAAFACRTRAQNSGNLPEGMTLSVALAEKFYAEIELQVTRINAMTREPFEEPANRNYYCSPSSETYFTS